MAAAGQRRSAVFEAAKSTNLARSHPGWQGVHPHRLALLSLRRNHLRRSNCEAPRCRARDPSLSRERLRVPNSRV